jgi:hypothetical protein
LGICAQSVQSVGGVDKKPTFLDFGNIKALVGK